MNTSNATDPATPESLLNPGTLTRRVYDALAATPMTRHELPLALGLSPRSIPGATGRLRKARLIEPSGTRRRTAGSLPCVVWRAVTTPPPPPRPT